MGRSQNIALSIMTENMIPFFGYVCSIMEEISDVFKRRQTEKYSFFTGLRIPGLGWRNNYHYYGLYTDNLLT